jgi:hypothetical protein
MGLRIGRGALALGQGLGQLLMMKKQQELQNRQFEREDERFNLQREDMLADRDQEAQLKAAELQTKGFVPTGAARAIGSTLGAGVGSMLSPTVNVGGQDLTYAPQAPAKFDPSTDEDIQRKRYMIENGLMADPTKSGGGLSVSEQIALANFQRGVQGDARTRAESKLSNLLAANKPLYEITADPEIAGVFEPAEVVGRWQAGLKKDAPKQTFQERKEVNDLSATLKAVDNALAQIESNPKAIGLKHFFLPKQASQLVDPDGVPVRAAVGDVGSQVTLARSGGAVSDKEFERIQPFIPGDADRAGPATAKLEQLRSRLADKLGLLGVTASQAPAGVLSPREGAPLKSMADRAAELKRANVSREDAKRIMQAEGYPIQ